MGKIIAKLHELLDKANVTNWLGILLFITLILRIPSFFEPYFYGDEMIYLSIGQGIRKGLDLYTQIFDNKPPLIYLTAAIAGNLFLFKTLLAFWNIVSIVLFWNLTKILFAKSEKAQKVSTVIFALLTTLPTLEGLTVNAELFMIGFSLWALLILLSDNLNTKRIVISGILFGIGALFKIPASFDVPIIIFYWLLTDGFGKWKEIVKKTFFLSLGFALPLLLTFVWFFFEGSLTSYITAVFFQNVGYISSWGVSIPFTTRAGAVIAGLLILFLARKKVSKNFILFSLWTLFGLFATILSERPYPHYLVQVAAPMALLLATLLAEKSLEQSLSILPLALTLFVPFHYNFYAYPTVSYYQRFVNFSLGKISKDEYFSGFSPNVKRNYEIANFLMKSSSPDERVFMWDNDSPTVYSLSKRLSSVKYVADYHIIDYSNKELLAEELTKTMPKFIILTSNHPLPEINKLLGTNYLMIAKIDNAEIWSRLKIASKK